MKKNITDKENKDFLIKTVIEKYFEQFYPNETVYKIDVFPLTASEKSNFPGNKFKIEVETAYSITNILLGLGYSKEEITKNYEDDEWLSDIEYKHSLHQCYLTSPYKAYCFIGDREINWGNPGSKMWQNYYNELKSQYHKHKEKEQDL